MINQKHLAITLVFLTILSLAYTEELTIASVERQVLLNGQHPVQQTFVKFTSHGNVNTFKHVVSVNLEERIRSIVFSKSKDAKESLPFTQQQYLFNGQKYIFYKVELDRSYFSDEQGQLYISITYLNRYINFPAEIAMNEDQKFEFFDNKYFLSPYPVKSQTTTYKFDKLIKHDKDGQVKTIGTLVFKKENAEPFTIEEHAIHGVNNKPQVYFTNVERIIEVSHWGNIAITQFYSLMNVGPSLKGEFSRISLGSQGQTDPSSAKNAFRGVEAQISYDAWGLYYRDEVGNISTSKAYRDTYSKKVKFALVPRFSLLGQWKANWEIGYNLPTKGFLFNQGSKFQMDNISLQYTLEKIVAEKYDFKIILPEGASNVKVKIGELELTPTRVEKSFGYLDFFGKPTFVFENHKGALKKKQITVDYELDTLSSLFKPIILFAFIFSALAVLIVARRLKFQAFKQDKTE